MAGSFNLTRNGADKIVRKISLPAAKAGTVTSGTIDRLLTLGSGHGITNSDLVGVFWTDAGVLKQRIDMTVSTTDTTTITATASTGIGDAFPANATTITVCKNTIRADITFLATAMLILTVGSPQLNVAYAFGVNFLDSIATSLLHAAGKGGECYQWTSATGPANPITGTVDSINCYHGSTEAVELAIGILIT
jgi:hypothetical protein